MFRPSDRQTEALAAMEAFVGIRNPRTDFADQAAFQTYWDLVARRGDAAKRSRATATPASRAAERQRREERSAAYYQDPEHLFAYARAYAKRYQPASAKLRQQLTLKCDRAELVEDIMQRLSERLDDDARALDVAEAMQRQGRNAPAIRAKLRQRQFSTEVITRCLSALTADTGSVLNPEAITRKIQQFQKKGLSQRAMRSKLMGQSADAPVLAAAFAAHSLGTLGGHGDDLALRTAIIRLQRKPLDRRALIQRLSAKGFRYADSVRILNDLAAEQEAAASS